jgi:hypothetical protein
MKNEDIPIADYVGRLLDQGKAYARAEFGLAKAKAEDAAADYGQAAMFGAGAAVFALVSLIVLFVTLAIWLGTLIGPLGGGLVATGLAAAIAGLLGWFAKKKVDERDA